MSHTTISQPSLYNIPAYIPSPEEIQAACREIQATWSEEERIRRRAKKPIPRVVTSYKISLPQELEAVA